MKRIISVCLMAFIALSTSCFAFTDVEDEQLEKKINELSELNIINGYENGTFKPQKNITRAEFSKIIIEAVISDSVFDALGNFEDVSSEHWAFDHIYKAKQFGIVNGTSSTTFAPESNITYEQAIKMIVCAIGYGDEALQEGGWPNGYIIQANKLGILGGIAFVQTDFATRADIAKMVRNALDIPFYYLVSTDDGLEREYSEECIFDIKSAYLNVVIDEQEDDEDSLYEFDEEDFAEDDGSVG